ncbi:MAG: WD40 repeat domain-containing protein, partial [Polyangiaceae bacterium]
MRAGVLPRLAEQKRWLVVRMRPGRHPFEVLAEELINHTTSEAPPRSDQQPRDEMDAERSRIAALATQLKLQPGQLGAELRERATQTGSRVLLFVDQLEEIVTLVDDKTERERFMVALCRAADDPLGPVRLVLTVRDDFVGQLVNSVEVRDALGSMFFLQRPSPAALESTLRKPVAALGYAYDDPELPKAMVAAVDNESACLPLLQFAAQQLWEARDQVGRLLLREVYVAIGGVEGALAKHADGVLDALSALETRAARQIFLRLVTSQRTRRVLDRGELLEGLGLESTTVLERLAAARLLTIRLGREAEEPIATVELAHESLIARWTTLRRWLDEGQDELVFLAEAGQAAALWDKRGRLDEELWQDRALADAQRMIAKLRQVLPWNVARFIAAAERKQAKRVRFRRQLLVAVVTGLTLVVAVLGWQKNMADEQRTEAQAQRAEAQAQRAEAQIEGARAALSQGKLLETRGKLRLALESTDAPSARALWWQLRDEPLVWTRELGAAVYEVAFSPDGKFVAAACQDEAVHLFDTQTRTVKVLRGHDDQVFTVRFSPDGKRLASGDWNGTVRLWDLGTTKLQHTLSGHTAGIRSVSFSPDGRLLASASLDRTVRVWDARTATLQHTLRGHTAPVLGVSFSPDGRRLASGGEDKTVRLWDPRTGKLQHILTGHTAQIWSVSFSPDGRRLASGSQDHTIRLWDAETAKPRRILVGHRTGVLGVSFSP